MSGLHGFGTLAPFGILPPNSGRATVTARTQDRTSTWKDIWMHITVFRYLLRKNFFLSATNQEVKVMCNNGIYCWEQWKISCSRNHSYLICWHVRKSSENTLFSYRVLWRCLSWNAPLPDWEDICQNIPLESLFPRGSFQQISPARNGIWKIYTRWKNGVHFIKTSH